MQILTFRRGGGCCHGGSGGGGSGGCNGFGAYGIPFSCAGRSSGSCRRASSRSGSTTSASPRAFRSGHIQLNMEFRSESLMIRRKSMDHTMLLSGVVKICPELLTSDFVTDN